MEVDEEECVQVEQSEQQDAATQENARDKAQEQKVDSQAEEIEYVEPAAMVNIHLGRQATD